ncbi:MAG: hypothetical protein IJA87_05545 [Clostridia bacterium]|nr:hypothetical protein [Clostridia bacterium]
MGTSVLLIFLVPFIAISLGFDMIGIAINGPEKSEIRLPYDPDKSLVWTYDDVNDPDIKLVETTVERNEQVFHFTYESDKNFIEKIFDIITSKTGSDTYAGTIMDVVFTDQNGNRKTYYVESGITLNKPKFYPAEECLTAQYTCVAQAPIDGAVWSTTSNSGSSGNVLYQPLTDNSTQTFTVVALPSDIEEGHCSAYFAYADYTYLEKCYVYYKIADSELTVSNIRHDPA